MVAKYKKPKLIPDGMAWCPTCHSVLPASNFGKSSKTKTGICNVCKNCSRTDGAKRRGGYRWEALVHYGGNPPKCACCGETTVEFLAIDHVNGDGNRHRQAMAKSGTNMITWIRKMGYPQGFRVLCHNCNMALGFYGYCPHDAGSKYMEWVEASGRVPSRSRGETHGSAKLSTKQVIEIKAAIAAGVRLLLIARHYNVDKSTIERIKWGKTWKHIPDQGLLDAEWFKDLPPIENSVQEKRSKTKRHRRGEQLALNVPGKPREDWRSKPCIELS